MAKPINKTRVNLGALDELLKDLNRKISIKIGIVGDKATQKHEGINLTNAELGAVHEFGATINHPGGQPYYINSTTGMAVFVSKNSAFGKYLIEKGRVTKPHKIIIPTRSFLRMPLLGPGAKKVLTDEVIKRAYHDESLSEFLKSKPSKNEANNVFRNAVKDTIPKNILGSVADNLAEAAKDRVLEAFETNGFGNWKPTTNESRKKRKGNPDNPTLVSTGDLKDSIAYEIKK